MSFYCLLLLVVIMPKLRLAVGLERGKGTVYDDLARNPLNKTSSGWSYSFLQSHCLCKEYEDGVLAIIGTLYECGVAVNPVDLNAALGSPISTAIEPGLNPFVGKIIEAAAEDGAGKTFFVIDTCQACSGFDLDFTPPAAAKLKKSSSFSITSQIFMSRSDIFVYPNDFEGAEMQQRQVPSSFANKIQLYIDERAGEIDMGISFIEKQITIKQQASIAVVTCWEAFHLKIRFLNAFSSILLSNVIISRFVIDNSEIKLLSLFGKPEESFSHLLPFSASWKEVFPSFLAEIWNTGLLIISPSMQNKFIEQQQRMNNFVFVTKKFFSYQLSMVISPLIFQQKYCVCLDTGNGATMLLQIANEFVSDNAFDLMVRPKVLPKDLQIARWKLVECKKEMLSVNK